MPRGRQTPPSYHQGYARSAGESAYPGSWRGLIGAWVPALGPTGLTLRDVSGYGRDGTLTSMTTSAWIISADSKRQGYALSFGGDTTDDNILISDNDAFSFVGDLPFSIIAWGYLTSTAAVNKAILMKWNSASVNQREYQFYITTGNAHFFAMYDKNVSGNNIRSFGDNDLSTTMLNKWVHYAATYDGSNSETGIKVYINGIQDAGTQTENGTYPGMTNTAVNLLIGARNVGASLEWPGNFAEHRLYNRELSAGEMLVDSKIPLAPFVLRPRAFVKAPAAAGGLSIPVGMAQYYRQHNTPWF